MAATLILMLKYPRPGSVKTRLIPALGEKRACDLYRKLVCHTLEEARRFGSESAVRLTAYVANAPDESAAHQWLGEGIQLRAEGVGNLGQRMEHATCEAFAEGASSVIIVGADCPQLTAEHLHSASSALTNNDLVLGPAADGGYYLIAMRRHLPELFSGIEWSSERVLEQTLNAARAVGAKYFLLETLHDLDCPEDLTVWSQTPAAHAAGKYRVSVIIPTLNDAGSLAETVAAAQKGQPYEIILADGGSKDSTLEIARSLDLIVLGAPDCRAAQMNRGAAVATGEYILFLHADTLLPPNYLAEIRPLLSDPRVVGGAFRLAIAEPFFGRSFVERTANWRSRRWQLPYGDQAFFLRSETFARLGGFREMPIMEDYELVRRLRRLGRIAIAESSVVTSGRRWLRLGCARTTLINQAMILGYHLGISPSRLAAWYRGQRSRRGVAGEAADRKPQTVRSDVRLAGIPPVE